MRCRTIISMIISLMHISISFYFQLPGALESSIRDLPPSTIGDGRSFDAKGFVAENKGKSLEAIVEHVRDGSTIRVHLIPSFLYVQVYVAGVQVWS